MISYVMKLYLEIFIACECQQQMTVCPKHGNAYGIRWRTGKTTEVAGHETTSKAPVIWSRVPETTLPRATLGELTFHCVAENVKQLFI